MPETLSHPIHEHYSFIEVCLNKNIPFCTYRLPGESSFHTIIQLSKKLNHINLETDFEKCNGFIVAPFDHDRWPTILISPDIEFHGVPSSGDIDLLKALPENTMPADNEPIEISKETYLLLAHNYTEAFQSKTLRKAILSRILVEEKPTTFHPADFTAALSNAYPKAFVYYFHLPGIGSWCGATPEMLLTNKEGNCRTVALAATQKAADIKTANWTEKEKEEQALVEEYIEEVLKSNQIVNYKKVGPENSQAGHLVHLKTQYSFSIDNSENDLGLFIQNFHPTPAVSGLPKEEAFAFIQNTEPHDREYYAGFLGPVTQSNISLYVNLRCMKVLHDKLALYVGGGLTASSKPESEWEETVLKAHTLLSVLKK